MQEADLLSWANATETIRLPRIESDLNQHIIVTDGELADHNARIDTAQSDATYGRQRSDLAHTRVYDAILSNEEYVDRRIQDLKDDLALTLGSANIALSPAVQAAINGAVTTEVGSIEASVVAEITAKNAAIQAAANQTQQARADILAATDSVFSGTLPTLEAAQDQLNLEIPDIRNSLAVFLQDYPHASVQQGFDEVGAQVGNLSATLTTSYYTAADVDTAMGGMQTTLSSEIDGVAASVTTLGGTVASMDGTLASSYIIQSTAGINAGRFSVTAWDGGSAIELSADDIIANGTMSVDKLRVGVGGNLLEDTGWNVVEGRLGKYSPTPAVANETTAFVRPAGSTWAGRNYNTLAIHQQGTSQNYTNIYLRLVGGTSNTMSGVPCKPGEWIELGAQASSHRCSGYLKIFFRDAAGNLLSPDAGDRDAPIAEDVSSSDTDPNQWPHYWTKARAPAGTTHVSAVPVKMPTTSGSDSWLFLHNVMFARTTEFATEATPFAPSGGTIIDGQGLLTNSVTADKLTVADLSAISATIGHFKSAPSGERVEIKDDGFEVYDGSGNIRVRIGRLS